MSRASIGLLLAALAVGALATDALAQAPAPPKFRYEQKIMADTPPGPPPLKKRVAVARFDDSAAVADSPFGSLDPETQKKYQNDDINSPLAKDLAVIRNGFTERLITALFATDRFIVVERRDIHKILREQEFAKTDRMAKASALPQGEMLSAQYIITGMVTLDHGEGMDTTSDSEVEMAIPIPGSRFRTTVGSGRASSSDPGATESQGGDPSSLGDRSLLGDAQFECRRANRAVPPRFALHMRVYDVSTSQVVSAVRVSADNQWCLVKAGVQRMVHQVNKFPWKTRVAAVSGERVVIDGGRDVNMAYGLRLMHQASGTAVEVATRMAQGAAPELQVVEIQDTASVVKPMVIAPTGGIRPGDWVVSNPPADTSR
ncbi:MAG TPA: CsgG/HfaB family protein [Methylomirabilota bacterium]|nr:CsgG/HfaB family protein [Methylomirabilota bacterium]